MVLATESIKAKNKCLNGKHLLAEKYLGKGILSFVKPEMEKKKNLKWSNCQIANKNILNITDRIFCTGSICWFVLGE